MPNLFPYTNGHELNLDWILQVVKDFQTKYTTFDQALADALEAIETAKTGSLEDMQAALTAALESISTDLESAKEAISADQASALEAVQFALTSALAALTTSEDEAIARINSLYNTLPASAQDILSRLNYLDNIITGNTMESFTWLQGAYLYETAGDFPTPPAINTDSINYTKQVSSRYMTGVAGRRIRIITDGTILINAILDWTNTPVGGQPGAYAPGIDPGVGETYTDLLLPLNVTAFSIMLSKADPTKTISPSDIAGHIEIQWITDFVSQRVIAPKESSLTADVARDAGELFFYEGVLYTALEDIAIGDTIIFDGENANCIETNINAALNNIANQAAADVETLGDELKICESLTNGGKYTIQASDLESGQWSYSAKETNPARARTKYLIHVKEGTAITYENTTFDVYFGVLETPTSLSYIQTPGWQTGSSGTVTITKDGWLTFNIRNHAEITAAVDPADYDSVVTIIGSAMSAGGQYNTREAWLEAFPSDKLADIPVNKIICIGDPACNPSDKPETFYGTVVTFCARSALTPGAYQVLENMINQTIWVRHYKYRVIDAGGNYWGDWGKLANQAAVDADMETLGDELTICESLTNGGKYTIKASDLESGVWNFSTKSDNAARARIKYLIPVRAGMIITYENTTFDVYFGVLETPTSPSYIQTPGWQTGSSGTVTITKDGWLTFNIRNHAEITAAVNPADYDSVVTVRALKAEEYHVGTGQAYTSFTSLLLDLKGNIAPKTIYIHEGEYDVFAEYLAEVSRGRITIPYDDITAGNYFEPYNAFVPNNTRIVGLGNVTLKFTPTVAQLESMSTNPEKTGYGASRTWSPLNIYGSVEIENVTVVGKNCRYCLHNDDHNAYPNARQHYKNCRFLYTYSDLNSQNQRLGFNITIGFGIQAGGVHIFDDCEIYMDANTNASAYYGHEWEANKNGKLLLRNCRIHSSNFSNNRVIMLQSLATTQGQVTALFENCYVNGGLLLTLYYATSLQNFDTTFVGCNKVPVIRSIASGGTITDIYTVKWYNPLPTPTAQSPQYEEDTYSGT